METVDESLDELRKLLKEEVFTEKIKTKGFNNKLVVHIGESSIQLISFSVVGGKFEVTATYSFDSKPYFKSNDIIDTMQIAQDIKSLVNKEKLVNKGKIVLVLPDSFYDDRLVNVTDKKMTELGKYFETEYYQEQGFNITTSVSDWVYLSETEENGEIAKVCLVSSCLKRNIERILSDLSNCGFTMHSLYSHSYCAMNYSSIFDIDYSCRDRLIIKVDNDSTDCFVIKDNNTIYLRAIKSSKSGLIRNLVDNLNVTYEEVIEIIDTIGINKCTQSIIDRLSSDEEVDVNVNFEEEKEEVEEEPVLSIEEMQKLLDEQQEEVINESEDSNFIDNDDLENLLNTLNKNEDTKDVEDTIDSDETEYKLYKDIVDKYHIDLKVYFKVIDSFIDGINKEIIKIVQLCKDNNSVDISKLIIMSEYIKGLDLCLSEAIGIPLANYDFNETPVIHSKNLKLNSNDMVLDRRFNIAIGAMLGTR